MTENILQIRPVSRELTKFIIGLAGQSGDGKTRSALELAHGLTDFKPEKIGFLDTENRRGSLYSNVFGTNKFLIGDLTPPFSPARYIAAMRQFAEQEIEVLVIDSTSHEWEGEGGCEDIAESALQRGKKVKDWIGAKREHKKFMNTMLFLPMHIICCIRAREKTDFKSDPSKPTSLGIQPIAEKNFMFEMTISYLLKNHGKARDDLKPNDQFGSFFQDDGYLTPDHGKKLRDWIGGFDPLERAKASLRLAASQGTEMLKAAWLLLPAKTQKELREFKDTLKDLAAHADIEATQLPTASGDKEEWA